MHMDIAQYGFPALARMCASARDGSVVRSGQADPSDSRKWVIEQTALGPADIVHATEERATCEAYESHRGGVSMHESQAPQDFRYWSY